MSVTTEPEFYDRAMTDAHEPAMLPLEQSPWAHLYEAAADFVGIGRPVCDLGSGTGRFAELLRRRGVTNYLGVDFSPAAVAEAILYVPSAEFVVDDLRTWTPDENRGSNTVYVTLEVLEHLEDDIDLIRRIPVGHEVIFSVPNYGGEAHLRTFNDVSDAWTRYGHLVTFKAWQLIGAGPLYFIHLYRAVRRGEAW